jgi:hypothetical protein
MKQKLNDNMLEKFYKDRVILYESEIKAIRISKLDDKFVFQNLSEQKLEEFITDDINEAINDAVSYFSNLLKRRDARVSSSKITFEIDKIKDLYQNKNYI